MLLNTGYSIISIGKISAIGIRENDKPRMFLGLYVKDVFGNERVYEVKVGDAMSILKQLMDGKTGMLDGKYSNILEYHENQIAAKGWVELTFSELSVINKLVSSYNFTVEDF